MPTSMNEGKSCVSWVSTRYVLAAARLAVTVGRLVRNAFRELVEGSLYMYPTESGAGGVMETFHMDYSTF